jgi:2-(1,2-epoxy-1,2-dihydrophenyl)acetyl-CoA isomerase
MADVLLVERDAGVATLTLNRPDAMNSLSLELKEALRLALDEIGSDPDVRAVVLTGSGRGFCAGQDLLEHAQLLDSGDPAPLRTVREHFNKITLALLQMPKPVIAAVNGTAAGAGASLAFAADLRVVSTEAKFLLAFANAGLALDTGASWTLPRLVGTGRALELSLLAKPITAQTAEQYGLVTELVEPSEVATRARELATRLAAGPTVAYRLIKQAVEFAASHDLAESLEYEAVLQEQAGTTADHRIAVTAFNEKARPEFLGR